MANTRQTVNGDGPKQATPAKSPKQPRGQAANGQPQEQGVRKSKPVSQKSNKQAAKKPDGEQSAQPDQAEAQSPAKQPTQGQHPGYSEEEQKKEAQKAAQGSLEAQARAHELTQAALGAGDPETRQKLLQDALNKEIEAGSLGKVAKWINSGAVQGFVKGSIPGVTLGALVGILVGGLVSLITGGIGAGIGALTGPTFKLGDLAGKGIRKITGDFPGWESTKEQEETLRSMVMDVDKQKMPTKQELEAMGQEQGISRQGYNGKSWSKHASGYASGWMPSWAGGAKPEQQAAADPKQIETSRNANAQAMKDRMGQSAAAQQSPGTKRPATSAPAAESTPARKPAQAGGKSASGRSAGQASGSQPRKPPRKLQMRSQQ